jgi:hypothetical protein
MFFSLLKFLSLSLLISCSSLDSRIDPKSKRLSPFFGERLLR